MANIDLAITTPAPQEPEKPVRAQNEEAAAWAIREKNYDSAMTRYTRHVGMIPTASVLWS